MRLMPLTLSLCLFAFAAYGAGRWNDSSPRPGLSMQPITTNIQCLRQILAPVGDGVNLDFYEDYVTWSIFRKRAEDSGLADYQDLKVIVPLVEQIIGWKERPVWPSGLTSYRAYEVGAGFGRVLDYFRTYPVRIDWTAWEQTPLYANMLTSKFMNLPAIHIETGSFLRTRIQKKAHVIFMLWGTLVEFSPAEQARLLAKARRLLLKGGVLVTDLPVDMPVMRSEHVTSVENATGGRYLQYRPEPESPHVWQGYLPYPGTFRAVAESQGLREVAFVRWQALENSERVFQFFMRPDEVPARPIKY